MESIFLLKFIHLLGASVLFGTGVGIAFFMLMAHRTGHAGVIAVTARFVVIADLIFTATAVVVQPVSGVALAWSIGLSPLEESVDRPVNPALRSGRPLLAAGRFHSDPHAQSGQRGGGQRQALAGPIPAAVPHLVCARLAGFCRRHRHFRAHDLAAALVVSSTVFRNGCVMDGLGAARIRSKYSINRERYRLCNRSPGIGAA